MDDGKSMADKKHALSMKQECSRLWSSPIADGFLSPPFNIKELSLAINQVTSGRRRVVEHPLPTVYMLTALVLSQRRVSSSRTNRPCIPFGARYRGHVEMMWSAVYSEAPHSQFGEGATPHWYMDEWNRPTPVHRRFSFTHDVLGKSIPRGLGLALGIKA